jgi:hypothetical protein
MTDENATPVDDRFRPTSMASGPRLIAAIVLGPLLWAVGFMVVALVVHKSDAVELGLLVVVGSILLAAPILIAGRVARRREERRYASRG